MGDRLMVIQQIEWSEIHDHQGPWVLVELGPPQRLLAWGELSFMEDACNEVRGRLDVILSGNPSFLPRPGKGGIDRVLEPTIEELIKPLHVQDGEFCAPDCPGCKMEAALGRKLREFERVVCDNRDRWYRDVVTPILAKRQG